MSGLSAPYFSQKDLLTASNSQMDSDFRSAFDFDFPGKAIVFQCIINFQQ